MQPKKKSHCAHFIQYQHTNHAKDIIDIIPPSSSGCFFLDSETFVNIIHKAMPL